MTPSQRKYPNRPMPKPIAPVQYSPIELHLVHAGAWLARSANNIAHVVQVIAFVGDSIDVKYVANTQRTTPVWPTAGVSISGSASSDHYSIRSGRLCSPHRRGATESPHYRTLGSTAAAQSAPTRPRSPTCSRCSSQRHPVTICRHGQRRLHYAIHCPSPRCFAHPKAWRGSNIQYFTSRLKPISRRLSGVTQPETPLTYPLVGTL